MKMIKLKYLSSIKKLKKMLSNYNRKYRVFKLNSTKKKLKLIKKNNRLNKLVRFRDKLKLGRVKLILFL